VLALPVILILEVLLAKLLGSFAFLNDLLKDLMTLACRKLLSSDRCQRFWWLPYDVVKADPCFVIIVIGVAEHNYIVIIG